ncbi:MAG: hypothetical protein JWP13_101 [Candidatus Saccharibacteria bacterium]|nr:hypothetical protein [Candidatus Saccharibacteria bacterium]
MATQKGESITQERPALEVISAFCVTASTSYDVAELQEADIIDDYLYENSPESTTGGIATYGIRTALIDLQNQPADPERHTRFFEERRLALAMVIRGIIQGSRIPLADFPDALAEPRRGLLRLGLTTQQVDQRQKGQALSIWKASTNIEVRRRAAEAYMPVGSAVRYGIMMGRMAAASRL